MWGPKVRNPQRPVLSRIRDSWIIFGLPLEPLAVFIPHCRE